MYTKANRDAFCRYLDRKIVNELKEGTQNNETKQTDVCYLQSYYRIGINLKRKDRRLEVLLLNKSRVKFVNAMKRM